MISADRPLSAETTLIIRRPCIVSIDGNGVATLNLLSQYTLATGSQFYRKDYSPSSVSFSLHPFSSPVPVSTSLIPNVPVYLTLGHVIFRFKLLFICNPSSIKAALFLYYT